MSNAKYVIVRNLLKVGVAQLSCDFTVNSRARSRLDATCLTRHKNLQGLEELLPGVEFACEASYALTQEDVDAAELLNTGVVSGSARDVGSTQVRRNKLVHDFPERLPRLLGPC